MMVPRETPLCLGHFLAYMRHLMEEDYKQALCAKEEKTKIVKQAPRPAPPTRVQPRRSARNKTPVYIRPPTKKAKKDTVIEDDSESYSSAIDEEESSKGDTSDSSVSLEEDSSDDDAPIRKRKRASSEDLPYEESQPLKRRKLSVQPIPIQKQRQINTAIKTLEKQILKVAKPLEASTSECVYGFKPWICPACPVEIHHTKCQLDDTGSNTRFETVAEVADMAVVECKMALRFEGDIPRSHRFYWKGEDFAVDACNGVKILLL